MDKTPPWKPPYCRNLYGKRSKEDEMPEDDSKGKGPGYEDLLFVYSFVQETQEQLMETQKKLSEIEKNMIECLTAVEKELRAQKESSQSTPKMEDL